MEAFHSEAWKVRRASTTVRIRVSHVQAFAVFCHACNVARHFADIRLVVRGKPDGRVVFSSQSFPDARAGVVS
jgi:hypothetical protein